MTICFARFDTLGILTNRMRSTGLPPLRFAFAFLALGFALAACGGEDDEVPIDEIPQDKPVTALSDAEERGLCSWAKGVAKSELPPAGTQVRCGGLTITMASTQCMNPTSPSCPATVGEWRACFPAFIARIGDDPCLILQLQAPGALSEFLEATPGCAGMGACGTTMP